MRLFFKSNVLFYVFSNAFYLYEGKTLEFLSGRFVNVLKKTE